MTRRCGCTFCLFTCWRTLGWFPSGGDCEPCCPARGCGSPASGSSAVHSEVGLLGHVRILISYLEEPPNCSVAARPSYVPTQCPWVAASLCPLTSTCCLLCDGGRPDRWCEVGLHCRSVGIPLAISDAEHPVMCLLAA